MDLRSTTRELEILPGPINVDQVCHQESVKWQSRFYLSARIQRNGLPPGHLPALGSTVVCHFPSHILQAVGIEYLPLWP